MTDQKESTEFARPCACGGVLQKKYSPMRYRSKDYVGFNGHIVCAQYAYCGACGKKWLPLLQFSDTFAKEVVSEALQFSIGNYEPLEKDEEKQRVWVANWLKE